MHVSVQETVDGEEGLHRPGVPTRRRSCLKLQTARRISQGFAPAAGPFCEQVAADKLTADMNDSFDPKL